jgi:cell pole-organizing protein PopZ
LTRKTLDPNLASILDSIRATVGGDAPPPAAAPVPEQAEVQAEPDEGADQSRAQKASRAKKAAVAPAPAVTPQIVGGSRTVEDFLAELIRPQVDAWLKANLPELIQKMAAEEIARLTGRK